MDKQIFNFTVEAEFNDWRIDKWLAKMVPTVSRVKLQKMIKAGFVLDGNDEVVADVRLKISEGESFTVTIVPEEKSFIMKPQEIPLDILFEDEAFLIINKSSNMPVHPSIL
ncbi:MAG: RNA pseudouridine synthase, partial [Alphaproteobacteria bacterium]|nr:RNA pseudouridine synthase [Alphaproteobacteria bacterium]